MSKTPKPLARLLFYLLAWILPVLFALSLLPRIYTFIEAGISRVAWPWQIDYTEGVNLNATYMLSLGHNIYRHNRPDGFLSAPYSPLLYVLIAPFQWISGPSFGVGRLVSLLSAVVVAFLIGLIVWKMVGNWPSAALAGGLWLSLSPVIVWSAFFKQDFPAMAFDLAGLAWAMYHPSGRKLLWAAAFFTVAFYFKQSALVGAAATTLWLAARDLRVALRFGATLTGMVLVPFLAANLLLQGGLWEHLVGYQALPYTRERFLRSITKLQNEYWPVLIVSGATLLGLLATLIVPRNPRPQVPGPKHALERSEGSKVKGWTLDPIRARLSSPQGLLLLYFILGWAATLGKAGRTGANFNHLLDGLLPTCILVGLAAGYAEKLLRQAQRRRQLLGVGAMLGFGLLMMAQLLSFTPPQTWFTGGWPSTSGNRAMLGLSDLVASIPGDMFSEDAYILLRNHKLPVYEDASTFVPLANLHAWDDSQLNQALRDRRFSLILLMHNNARWTEAGLRTFDDNYDLKFFGTIDVYEPKLFPQVPQYKISCELTSKEKDDTTLLTGYSLPPGVAEAGVKAGDVLRARLYWQPHSKLKQTYASYVHLFNEQGKNVAGQDNPQTGAVQPTTAWQPNQPITDTVSIPLPGNLPPGRYRLLAGMYHHAENGSITPLSALCNQGEADGDTVSLGWVEVKNPTATR